MRVLVACEYSGAVRDAFRAEGHSALSCDLLPTESPGAHFQGDVRLLLDGWEPVMFQGQCDPDGDGWCQIRDCDPAECDCMGPTMDEEEVEYLEQEGMLFARPVENPHWDLMIAHPPCTYLSVSGMHWTTRGLRDPQLTEDALDFVRLLMNAPIDKIVIENPVSVISSRIRKPDQVIQPWYFGDDASKKTCLWTKNLPPLVDSMRLPGDARTRRANQTPSGQNKLGPSDDRWKERSKTYPGIAQALAVQYGNLHVNWGADMTSTDLRRAGAEKEFVDWMAEWDWAGLTVAEVDHLLAREYRYAWRKFLREMK